MPAVVQHLAEPRRHPRRRVERRDGDRARHRDAAGPGQLRRPRQDRRGAEPRGRGRGHRSSSSRRARHGGSPRSASVLGLQPQVAIRVNPDFAVKGSGMRMGGGPQQFGVDVEQAPALIELVADLDLDLHGFHLFAGSQNLRAEILVEAQRQTVELLLGLADKVSATVTYLNLGGGFGIPYSESDAPLDLTRVGENLRVLVRGRDHPCTPVRAGRGRARPLPRRRGRRLRHPGRGPEGLARPDLPGRRRRHAPPARGVRQPRPGHPPQLPDRRRQPRRRARRRSGHSGRLPVHAARRARQRRRPSRGLEGDSVVLFQAGAYGYSASPLNFLGHPAPAEVLV